MALPFLPPASLDSAFIITRPKEADIDALSEVYFESFATDEGNTFWWSPDHDAMREWLRYRIQKKMADRSVRHFSVIDQREGNVVVSFARWDIPKGYETRFGEWVGGDDALDVSRVVAEHGTDEPATVAPVEEAEPTAVKTMAGPRGSDQELCQSFFSVLSTLSKKWNAEQMLGLSLLCTSPKYHRRGAAKALLAPMLAIADAAGLRTYLEATPGGRPVYEKLGFRTVEVKEFNIDALTSGRIKGSYKLSIMIREPQAL
ncbi:acyl-CoA N-acyltransferase [Xylaria arbuscula]|nr:acyl-CoA N-acyltransferase [Xylaria arbuscula]